MDENGVSLFPNTINCPLVRGSSQGEVLITSAIECATCHNLIGDQSRRFIFSRNMPRVTS